MSQKEDITLSLVRAGAICSMSSSLADELAADLLEDQTQGGNIEKDESVSSMFHISDASMRDASDAHAHGASQPPDELNQAQLDAWDVGQSSISDVSSISKLYGSKSLSELLQVSKFVFFFCFRLANRCASVDRQTNASAATTTTTTTRKIIRRS